MVSGTILLTRDVGSRTMMLSALGLIPASMGSLLAAQLTGSMPLMLPATGALRGCHHGLGECGSLQVINHIAPPGQRAEANSSYCR